MDYSQFVAWLEAKGLNKDSSRDVLSRYKRGLALVGQKPKLLDETIFLLKRNTQFKTLSGPVQSQLKRAFTLYDEFINRR